MQRINNIEDKLQYIVTNDAPQGVEIVFPQLKEEGYSISKKRVRASEKEGSSIYLDGKKMSDTNEESNIIRIISERLPEKHRILKIPVVIHNKKAGNRAFKSCSYISVDEFYSKALEHKNDEPKEAIEEEVAFWKLYYNHAPVRMKLAILHEARKDNLKSPCFDVLEYFHHWVSHLKPSIFLTRPRLYGVCE